MSVEPIKDVISLWRQKKITEVQVIGKILLWYLNLYTEHLQLKAQISRLESRLAKVEAKSGQPGGAK